MTDITTDIKISRSKTVITNIIGSVLVKGLSIIITLYLIPITVKLLNQEKYGIWLTMFSIISWFNMMDVGIGNGFRNKFAEAIALKNYTIAKNINQTFYTAMMVIAGGIFFLYLLVHPFLNWAKILNVGKDFNENINAIVLFTFGLFCLQLYLKNISTVLLSLQKTTISNVLFLFANILSLAGVFLLDIFHRVNLFNIACVYMLAPNLVFIITTAIVFTRKNLKELSPFPFKIFKIHLNGLVGLGIKFFLIQIATIIMFSVDNLIITQLYGPAQVTPYNIAYRLFTAGYTGFTIIISPFWSAFTEANTRNDNAWIIKSLKKLGLTWFVFAITLILILIFSKTIFKIWIGSTVIIPFSLSAQFCIFAILISWSGIFSYYLNGVGKIKLQLYISIFQCILNIPLAIYLSKYLNMGPIGIILATNLNLLIAAVILPIQVHKILYGKAKGIWLQ